MKNEIIEVLEGVVNTIGASAMDWQLRLWEQRERCACLLDALKREMKEEEDGR